MTVLADIWSSSNATNAVLAVLGKMEPPQFIHTYQGLERETRPPSLMPQPNLTDEAKQQQQRPSFAFELPRYGLEFKLHGNKLHSLDFKEYVLAEQQQLVSSEPDTHSSLYTLPGLQKYLVLHSSAESRRADLVLVPAGGVTLGGSNKVGGGGQDGQVTVQVEGLCTSKLQVNMVV